jgi:phage tail-like protein
MRLGLSAALCLALAGFGHPASAGRPAAAGKNTAYGPFTIKVEIEGVTQGVFAAVEGLASQSEVIAQDRYGLPSEAPGGLKGSRLILKRPYDPLLSGLWRWRQSVVEGDPQRRDGHIFVFNAAGQIVAHWSFRQGWPSRWEVPQLKAGSGEPAEEIVEIVHAGLALEPLSGS